MPKLSLNASKKTKHTPAGEIPVDWGWGKLESVATIQTGLSKSGNRTGPSKRMPYLRVANVQDGYFTLDEIKHIDVPENQVERFSVKKGDLLLTEGGDFDKLGRGAVWCGQIEPCVHQNHLFVVRGHSGVIEQTFLAAYTQSPEGRNYFQSCAKQSTNLASINSSQLKQLPVPLPPLPEQRRIAEILGTWDRAIETLESLIAAKERRKQALMQQLLTGRKRLPGFKGKWPSTHLGKLAQNISVRNNGKLGWDRLFAVTKADGMVPMREQVMGISTNNCKLVKHDDFAYNPMRLNIGSLARWQGNEDVMVSGDYIVFRCNEGELDSRFFDHLRRSEHWNQFVNVGGSGSVRVRLYFKDIAPFQIRCPSFKEQQAIATVLDTADRELTLHRQHLATRRTQKRGLMGKLLTGVIRIPN
jgi:type I restriction enzyme S subunit